MKLELKSKFMVEENCINTAQTTIQKPFQTLFFFSKAISKKEGSIIFQAMLLRTFIQKNR